MVGERPAEWSARFLLQLDILALAHLDFLSSRKYIFLPQSSKSAASIREDVFPLKSHPKFALPSLVHKVTVREKLSPRSFKLSTNPAHYFRGNEASLWLILDLQMIHPYEQAQCIPATSTTGLLPSNSLPQPGPPEPPAPCPSSSSLLPTLLRAQWR